MKRKPKFKLEITSAAWELIECTEKEVYERVQEILPQFGFGTMNHVTVNACRERVRLMIVTSIGTIQAERDFSNPSRSIGRPIMPTSRNQGITASLGHGTE